MTRKIKIYSTVGSSGTIETDVTTLGQLKPLLTQQGISYEGMKMLVGETRNELSVDEAVLPVEDFKLYLMPSKTKSGYDSEEEALDALDDADSALNDAKDAVANARAAIMNSSKVPTKVNALDSEDAIAMADLQSLANGGKGVIAPSAPARRNSWD